MSAGQLSDHVLLALGVIVVVAFTGGRVARRLGQPTVLGEMLGGIFLGPSLLGALWPAATRQLFPAPVVGVLRPVSQLGLVMFMFIVGLEFDHAKLRGQGRRALAISQASIVLPFVSGAGLALWLHGQLGEHTRTLPFVLFVGAAMSVTAFPVLARILQEAGFHRSPVGALAITCAAFDDVTAWIVLAGVLAIVKRGGPSSVLTTAGLALGLTAIAWWLVRPLLVRFDDLPLPVALGLALGCAWASQAIGIHAVFGAFLAGIVMPRDASARLLLIDRLGPVTTSVLLPVFFVVAGLSTRLDQLGSATSWAFIALIVLVAVVGKGGGSTLAARLTGVGWRDATTVGVLMNTRGLTELVILSVGLDAGLIGVRMYTMMVVMAVATSLMTLPLLLRLQPGLRHSGATPSPRADAGRESSPEG